MADPSARARQDAREPCVCAVIVTYHADLAILEALLDALAVQAGCVVVVDNASPGAALRDLCAAYAQVEWLGLPENRGLAAALNAGIARARLRPQVSHVLLMDQDSVPAPGMVATLKEAWVRLSRGASVAAVGPRFRDPREDADAPFVRFGFPFNRKVACAAGCGEVVCDFLITSGCLIPLAALDSIGGMDDALFIDNVDLDWCFRATHAGLRLYGVCAARMLHHHGAERRRVPGLPRGVIVHTPRRLYYMMRNRVLLYRRAYTPRRWIAQDLPRLVVKVLLFSLWVPPRWQNLRCMIAGLAAGIRGRTTPLPDID